MPATRHADQPHRRLPPASWRGHTETERRLLAAHMEQAYLPPEDDAQPERWPVLRSLLFILLGSILGWTLATMPLWLP
jgi:hypothetical protein